MANYNSVINTADNSLVRAEIREYILSLGLYWGFKYSRENAFRLYPDNRLRQKQYTELTVKYNFQGNKGLPEMLIDTATHYFKHSWNNDFTSCYFYDTKKFTHYRDRLNYGQEHKARLKSNTMQYMYTPVLLALLYSYCYKNKALDLSGSWLVTNAYDIEENISAIIAYMKDISRVGGEIKAAGSLILLDDEADTNLKTIVEAEHLKIKDKLIRGGYIKETDYGKKAG